ncbi:MAG: DNA-binding response regulator [Cytophagia bacterium]|nr:MAG: DNA-binding response regulator [Runella sp.]TAG20223.1 MAG: DNA-binding response regulator [Cytophagales bacterium]TAG39342.1 MAG: DNA-binding response regulator [Cytophagia bacterium]TAG81036.1 MAG: DNA-binding response regulator [Cytophagales bacterium]
MIRAILIDDEKPATELLEMKLRRLNMDVEIVAKLNQPEAAVEYLRTAVFDLLFLDIEMPRLNGFDLLAQFDTYHFDVIFTTAYDQYAIRAFRVSALSYLLKPIEEHDLREALSRWQKKQTKQLQVPQIQALQANLQPSSLPQTRLALPTQEGHEIIEIKQIIRCMADASYTHFYLENGQKLLICRTLKEVEQALESSGFVRVHQSHVINPAYLKKIVKQEGGYLLMADGVQVPVTKQKRDWLVEQFIGLNKN